MKFGGKHQKEYSSINFKTQGCSLVWPFFRVVYDEIFFPPKFAPTQLKFGYVTLEHILNFQNIWYFLRVSKNTFFGL